MHSLRVNLGWTLGALALLTCSTLSSAQSFEIKLRQHHRQRSCQSRLPQNNMVDKGAIRVFANAYTETVQTAMQVYIDGQLKLSDSESSFVDQTYSASPGQHQVVVKAWDADGHNVSKSAVVTVQ